MVTMNITALWDMTPCGLVIIRSVSGERAAYVFRRLKTEALSSLLPLSYVIVLVPVLFYSQVLIFRPVLFPVLVLL
jgi:hypothetical protein